MAQQRSRTSPEGGKNECKWHLTQLNKHLKLHTLAHLHTYTLVITARHTCAHGNASVSASVSVWVGMHMHYCTAY